MLAAATPTVLNAGDVRIALVVPPDPCVSLSANMNPEPGVKLVPPGLVYPVARYDQAAAAAFPPVELLTAVQAGFAESKLSDNILYEACEFDVADEVNATVPPGQIAVGDTVAVTAVGTGKTVAITAVRVDEQPVVVFREAAKYVVVVEMDGVVKFEVPVPPASGEPPVAAAYQSITAPAGGVALSDTVPVPHREPAVTVGAVTQGRKTKNIALLRSMSDRVTVPLPVEPAADFIAQAAPMEPSSTLVVVSSSISVKLAGSVATQFE